MARSRFTAFVGNVTRQSPKGWHHDLVVWHPGDKLNEAKMANLLQDAYDLGRKEALGDVASAIKDIK